MDNQRKATWPGWETVRLIGRGSFGAVYEIQRRVFDDTEKAALKVISIPQNSGDIDEMYNDGYSEEDITETFQSHLKSIVAEYSLMRKLNGNNNVVHCDDVKYIQHEDGVGWDIFIKMELLTPLMKALPEKIPEETVIKVAKDMCAALMECKKFDVVHRDIKPQNIFVSPNGEYKLGDFGIAKTVERTMGGTKIGTYKYMAPEVYNNQPYGSGADIYSLGLVMYWMLNERRMPFMPLPPAKLMAGMEENARERRFSGEAIPAPKNGSEKLQRIVLKACAFDPKERYASPAEMLEELTALNAIGANAVPIPILIPEPKQEPRPEPTPKPQSIPVVEPLLDPVPKSESKTMSAPKKKGKKKLLIGAGAILLAIVLVLMWPVYGPWSIWSVQKPVEGDEIKVESRNEYRFRNAVVLEANADSLPVDAEVIEQKEVWSEYSDWSTWQEEPVTSDETCQVESQVMYSSRKKTVTEEWSDWSSWSDWSTKETSETDSCQVKNRTVYCYDGFRYRCTICGFIFDELTIGTVSHTYQKHCIEAESTGYTGGNVTKEAVDNLRKIARGESVTGTSRDAVLRDAGIVYETKTMKSTEEKSAKDLYPDWGFNGNTYTRTEKQYSTRRRSKRSKETWSDWSEYVLEAPPEAENTEVKNRTVYRYRTRKMETLYQYRSWGEWSDWSTEIPNTSADTDSEQRMVYRYAEQFPLWKLLFGK